MTFLEKNIYNTYLKVSRTRNNLPYRFRKNFDNFKDSEHYVSVKRLGIFFNKFPHIKLEDFFNAPYEVYLDDDMFDLKFYTTPKATKMYGLYTKKRDDESPDSENQIAYIKSSLLFIYEYCRDNKLTLDEYINHRTEDIHTFLTHLRERKVSIYALFGLDGATSALQSYPESRLEFTLGKEFTKNVATYKIRLYNSRKAKRICEDGLAGIKKILHKIKNHI